VEGRAWHDLIVAQGTSLNATIILRLRNELIFLFVALL
jgi:hypothetical protein